LCQLPPPPPNLSQLAHNKQMLVGRYPFQSPADENALALGVVNMLKKMKSRDFELPPSLGLSPACSSLLRRLLEPDENARIRMEEIMQVGG